jgi:hypothetical protein
VKVARPVAPAVSTGFQARLPSTTANATSTLKPNTHSNTKLFSHSRTTLTTYITAFAASAPKTCAQVSRHSFACCLSTLIHCGPAHSQLRLTTSVRRHCYYTIPSLCLFNHGGHIACTQWCDSHQHERGATARLHHRLQQSLLRPPTLLRQSLLR